MARAALRLAAAAALFLLPAAGAAAAGVGKPAAAPALRTLIRPGERAPAFALKDLDGGTLSVAHGDGTPSLIVFFSVFCPLCRELAPSIADLAARRGPALRVIGVNLDGLRFSAAVRSFAEEQRLTFPVLLDEIRDDLFLASDPYGVETTPTAVLVDARGIVRAALAGEGMRNLVRDFDRIGAGLEQRERVPK